MPLEHQSTPLTLLIQVDALRHDHVTENDAPFLWELRRQGCSGKLQPTFGFEPDAAYLAGLYPDECDGGAHYWYEPEVTPFGIARCLPGFLDHLPPWPKKLFRRLLTAWVRSTPAYRYESVANIPLRMLPFLAPASKHLPCEPEYLECPTIFSLCDDHGIPWLFHAGPSCPVKIAAGVERLRFELKPPIGFAFWHIGDLDTAGHRYGPDSAERRVATCRVDAGIRDLLLHLKNLYDRIDCVIMGDHGMADVYGMVDVEGALRRAGIRQEQGLLYFLDSTMARFWFFDKRVKQVVISVLEKLHGGRILGQADLDRYHLNYPHNRFGDLFFLADPKVLIWPNFFQGAEIVKGMHGYAPEFADQQSAFVIHSPQISAPIHFEQPVDMRRIFPTVLGLLALDPPDSCRVESIA